jgi:hypothetical protein
VFPEDAIVFPVVHEPEFRGGNPPVSTLVWDEGQHLKSGYLASRTATQFMVQRTTTTEAQLSIDDSRQPPTVENRLQTSIRYVLLRDRQGDYFVGRAIADGGKLMLQKIDPTKAKEELEKLAEAAAPKVPVKDIAQLQNNALSFLSIQSSWSRGSDAAAGAPEMKKGLLEHELALTMDPVTQPLAPKSYTAIVESCPIVPSGVPRVREEASLHVVHGRYASP